MPRQQRIKSNSGYYHVMLRGNERRNIFLDEEDKLRFIETIGHKKEEQRFYLHAFCLMDNHVHLMISEGKEDIAKVIKRITVSYVFYFNKKYKRVGHLFQDRYKSEAVENDSYILSLARYIHQNPVKANMVRKPGDYKWSSYNGYLDDKNYLSKIIDKETLLDLLSSGGNNVRDSFIQFMNENSEENFMEIIENEAILDENEAEQLFKQMLIQRGINQEEAPEVPFDLICEFKDLSGLSVRKIACITKVNKDKISKILREKIQ